MQFSRYVFGFISQMRTKTLFYPQLTGKTHAVSFLSFFLYMNPRGIVFICKMRGKPMAFKYSHIFSCRSM